MAADPPVTGIHGSLAPGGGSIPKVGRKDVWAAAEDDPADRNGCSYPCTATTAAAATAPTRSPAPRRQQRIMDWLRGDVTPPRHQIDD